MLRHVVGGIWLLLGVQASLLSGEYLLLLLLEHGNGVGVCVLAKTLLLRDLVKVHGEWVVGACIEDR